MEFRNESANHALQDIRVVVADDDRFIRVLLDNRLASMGCITSQAGDGEEAWSQILATNPKLAFVDLDMPVLDGYELIARIRAHPRTCNIPVVVITSSSHAEAIERAFAEGATSFLVKPVRWSTFEGQVRYLLRLTDCAERSAARMRTAEAVTAMTRAVCLKALASVRHRLSDLRAHLGDLAMRADDRDAGSLWSRLEGLADDLARDHDNLRRAATACERTPLQVAVSDAPVPLVDIFATVAEASEDHPAAALEIDIPDDVLAARIACNRDSLANAVGQLLDNAHRHGHCAEPVKLAAKVHDDFMLTIIVEDRGAGMSPDFLNACLAPASALDGDVARSADALGLILARAIIEAHGGRLEVRSSPGAGTTAMLSIPPHRIWFDRVLAA